MKTIQNINVYAMILIATLLSSAASAQYASPEKCGSPYLQVVSPESNTTRIPLKQTTANVDIAGIIANVLITQVYVNEGENPIEAIYVFPGSTQAAVHGMTMTIGERRIVAKIGEKQKARESYEKARSEGRTASLLEQHRPNVFQMNVANIMPKDSLVVELRYTELLVPQDGMYSFVYPTVVGPRYNGDTGADVASATGGWIGNPYQAEGESPLYAFNISGTLKSGIPIQRASCKSHNLDIVFTGNSNAKFALQPGNEQSGNRDFILNYQLRGDKVESGVLLYEGKEENFFVAVIEPPQRVTPDQIPPREYLFVVDVSGSMNGFPIGVSKELMKELLEGLRPVDRFNVLLFASGNASLSRTALPATKDNIEKGIRLVEQQRGGGGTQLLPALKEALATQNDDGFSRTVVIATDGYIAVDVEAIDYIRDNLGEANFFTFGIGSSVNRFLLEGMAKVGKGESFVLTSEADAKAGAKRFRDYISSPVLTNIKVNVDGLMAYDIEPKHVPDVFADRPIIIYGKYKGKAQGTVKITGTGGNGPYTNTIALDANRVSATNEALQYLWARKRIELLDDIAVFGRSAESEKEVTALGLKYELLTQYTSFLAEDSEVRNAGGKQTTVPQPLPLPQGVSDMGGNLMGQSIHNLPSRGASMAVTSVAGVQSNDGAVGSVRGTRDQSTDTYVDGIKVRGSSAAKDKSESYKGRVDLGGVSAEKSARALKEEEARELAPADVMSSFDSEQREEIVLSHAEIMPSFVGGEDALKAYLKLLLNLSTEEEVTLANQGCVVSFVVGTTGTIADVKISKLMDKQLINRILKVFKQMPKWNEGQTAGQKVAVRMDWTMQL